MLSAAKGKTDSLSRWAVAVEARRGYWKAVGDHRSQECAHVLDRAQPRRVVQVAGLKERGHVTKIRRT